MAKWVKPKSVKNTVSMFTRKSIVVYRSALIEHPLENAPVSTFFLFF